jgi:hypothetical protein
MVSHACDQMEVCSRQGGGETSGGMINLIFRVDLTRAQYEELFLPSFAKPESPAAIYTIRVVRGTRRKYEVLYGGKLPNRKADGSVSW